MTNLFARSPKPTRRNRLPELRPALAACALAFAAGVLPASAMTVSQWAEQNRVVSAESGSPFAGKWSNDTAPYLTEIMDCLTLSYPATDVYFKKSHQVGGSEVGLNFVGYCVDRAPSPILAALPSINEHKRWVRLKWQPTVDETSSLRKKVRGVKSRDGDSSTTDFKRFPGGYLQVTSASSSKGLQMLTARCLLLEEISEYPLDVDGRGDPVTLAEYRTTTWSDRAKRFYVSTPKEKEICRISAKYDASDQRRYFVPCPHCQTFLVLHFDHLRANADGSVDYICQANGCVIEHRHKADMLRRGVWVKTFAGDGAPPVKSIEGRAGGTGDYMIAPDQLDGYRARSSGGRAPGFHIAQVSSAFVSWRETYQKWIDAKDDPDAQTAFVQQVLGEPNETAAGEAPDPLQLYARRRDFSMGRLPVGALIITAGVDVQKDRLEMDVWAWGIGKASWLIDSHVVEGDTDQLSTYRGLAEKLALKYEDSNGRTWPIEVTAIDSGYRTHTVYQWVRLRPGVMAIKGQAKAEHALGTSKGQEVRYDGRRRKGGVRVWPVGVSLLKTEFYGQVRRTIDGPDADGALPQGFIHLPQNVDEPFCRQLIAEKLVTFKQNRKIVQEWVLPRGLRNEALDKRIYAMAAAIHWGIDKLTPAAWLAIARERGTPIEQAQGDLLQLHGATAANAVRPPRSGRRRGADRGQVEV